MFFRDHYILRKFDLGDLATIDLSVPFEDGTLINVQLSKIPIDKLIAGQKEGDIRCIATVEKQFTARQTACFENLTDKIPDGIRQTISPIIDDLRFAVKRALGSSCGNEAYYKFTILSEIMSLLFNTL